MLTSPSSRTQHAPPFNVHCFNISNGRDEIGYLISHIGMSAPEVNVIFRWRLFSVFNFGHLGTVPTSESGQLSTGKACIFADVPQAVA